MLRLGAQIENYLRKITLLEHEWNDDALMLAPIAPRSEQSQRLILSDVFCDVPAWNSHALGCDAFLMRAYDISLLENKQVWVSVSIRYHNVGIRI